MKVCVLASGSTGNCTYIETNNYKILIDLGKNKKYIEGALKEINVNYKDIDYVILSHTHDDHTSAINTFLGRHKASLVISNKMAEDLVLKDNINVLLYENDIKIDNLDIKAIKLSHDVTDIRGFIITEDKKTVVIITDTGYLNSKYFKLISNKELYLIESNHDIEMLINGPYPDFLKKRVASDKGHLSNELAGIYLSKIVGDNTKDIMLLHLSEKNNTPKNAINTVKKYLKEIDYKGKLSYSKPNEISKVIII